MEPQADRPVKPDPEMWQAILKKVEEITKANPDDRRSMRGIASVDQHGCMSTVYKMDRRNGEDWVYLIEARRGLFRPETIRVNFSRYLDSHENYWNDQLSNRSNAVVIGGVHYRIGTRNGGEFAGHGGQHFRIKYLDDGRIVDTRDLWYQGPVPPMFRDQLPDTAEFVTPEEEVA